MTPLPRLLSAFVILLSVLVLSGPLVAASGANVVINSNHWKDVYAGSLYAQFNQDDFYFLSSVAHGDILPTHIRYKQPVILLESERAFVANYKSVIESRGFAIQEVLSKAPDLSWSQALGQRLNATRFLVLDGAFGYNAISAVSYAVRENAWVLFAEDFTPESLKTYLQRQNAVHVLQYGALPEDKRTALAGFNPEVIDKGDRFSNNVALLDRLFAKQPAAQLTLTNGEFIERSLIDGPQRDPVLLTGSQNVPPVTVAFLKQKNIQYGVLIGSDQAELGRWIKENTPMKYVYVKFAQSIIERGTTVAQPWALNVFPVPRVALNVTINAIQYNQKTSELEVVYQNRESVRTHLKASVDLLVGNTSAEHVEDSSVTILEAGAQKTATYRLTAADRLVTESANLSAEVTGLYGEEPGALERVVFERADNLAVISFSDGSILALGPLVYDVSRQGFELDVINSGPAQAYFEPHLRFSVSDEPRALSSKTLAVAAGERQKVFFHSPFTKEQLNDLSGAVISTSLNYGAREAFLSKTVSEDRLFSLLDAPVQNSVDWTLIVVALVGVAGALYFFTRGGKSDSGGFSARRRF